MNDRLDLRVDNEKKKRGMNVPLLYFLLAVSILLGAANLVFILSGQGEYTSGAGELPVMKLKELALKLERRGLSEAAARIWSDYLMAGTLEEEERAKIWYRVGKLYQETGDYDRAIEAYYRSESSAEIESLVPELSRRTTECYERLGMFSALGDELKDRTSLAGQGGEENVVAEIGEWKITESEMKRLMEKEVEMAIDNAAPGLTQAQRDAEKERMLDNAASPDKMKQWLENYVAEELIFRRAMELKLYNKKSYVDMCRRMERNLLVQNFLEQEYGSRISINEERLREYYKEHRDELTGEDSEPKPFDQVRQRVHMMLRREEELRVQREIMEDLMNRYDVVIHNSKFEEAR